MAEFELHVWEIEEILIAGENQINIILGTPNGTMGLLMTPKIFGDLGRTMEKFKDAKKSGAST